MHRGRDGLIFWMSGTLVVVDETGPGENDRDWQEFELTLGRLARSRLCKEETYPLAAEEVAIFDQTFDPMKHFVLDRTWTKSRIAVRLFRPVLTISKAKSLHKPAEWAKCPGVLVLVQQIRNLWQITNGKGLCEEAQCFGIELPQLSHLNDERLVCKKKMNRTEQPSTI